MYGQSSRPQADHPSRPIFPQFPFFIPDARWFRGGGSTQNAKWKSEIPGAFTLIELLVVIAIISILASMMLPVLSRAKLTAQSIRCTSNHQQLQLAWQMYAEDHEDRLVPNWAIYPNWSGEYRDGYSTTNAWVVGSAVQSDSTEGIRAGGLWDYTRSESLYRCPSDRSLWPYGARHGPRPFNVALNAGMNGGNNGLNGRALHPLIVEKQAAIGRPSFRFTFMDEEAASMTSGAFFVDPDQTNHWLMVPGARDRGSGANAAFSDGHVSTHRWRYQERTRPAPYTSIKNEADRADLAWIQSVSASAEDP
jgi:prepilin-type N-terminal cleavage/methylation domain-containing protein/prepilin-type processing-associated H-X9-DG protein